MEFRFPLGPTVLAHFPKAGRNGRIQVSRGLVAEAATYGLGKVSQSPENPK